MTRSITNAKPPAEQSRRWFCIVMGVAPTQRMTEAERREFQRLLLLAAQTALEQEG